MFIKNKSYADIEWKKANTEKNGMYSLERKRTPNKYSRKEAVIDIVFSNLNEMLTLLWIKGQNSFKASLFFAKFTTCEV